MISNKFLFKASSGASPKSSVLGTDVLMSRHSQRGSRGSSGSCVFSVCLCQVSAQGWLGQLMGAGPASSIPETCLCQGYQPG